MVNGVIEFEGDEKRVTSLALRGTGHLFFPRTVKVDTRTVHLIK